MSVLFGSRFKNPNYEFLDDENGVGEGDRLLDYLQ